MIPVFFLLLMAMSSPPSYQAEVSLQSHRAVRDFAPDGDLGKDTWRHATRAVFDHNYTGETAYPRLRTEIASVWTDHYVYFAFWCHYNQLHTYEGEDPSRERWELWERDVVEVFINPRPDQMNHYYEFEVAPNNQWLDLEIDLDKHPFNDAGWNSNFEHAVRVDSRRHLWTCEMRIPLAAMHARLAAGDAWRGNFYRAEGVGPDEQRSLLAWSPVPPRPEAFHNPSRFGLVRFVR
jgi:alpha-galactosidase